MVLKDIIPMIIRLRGAAKARMETVADPDAQDCQEFGNLDELLGDQPVAVIENTFGRGFTLFPGAASELVRDWAEG